MLSLSSHTAQRANTLCNPTFSAGAPPSPRWCPNGGPRPHMSGRGAILSAGLSPCPCTPNSQPPPPAEENQRLKTRPEGSCSPAPQCPIPHAGMAKRQPPPSPAHPPPRAPTHGDAPGCLTARHTPPYSAPPPPTILPPPPRQSGTQASKAPPSPTPCGTRQSSETRPPAPKTCPASITETQYRKPTSARAPAPQMAAHDPDMFNLPPPPRPAPPLAASTPVSAPSPCITRYFAPAPPPSREHKLTIVLPFVQRVISLKKPHSHVSLTPALNSPNTAQPISTTTLALTNHFCK